MFTTLNVNYKERKNFKEKMHLTPTRKLISTEHTYNNLPFYTTRLISYSHLNSAKLLRFKERCSLPVIENNSDMVTKYRYLMTLNTVMNHYKDTPLNCALIDPNGRLLFLLPLLVTRCHRVNVYTHSRDYQKENDRLFSLIGASAVIAEDFLSLKGFDAVFSDIPLPFCDNPHLFGRYSHFAHSLPLLPDEFKQLNLLDDEIYPTLAGLYYIGGIKNLGHLHCSTLQKTTTFAQV